MTICDRFTFSLIFIPFSFNIEIIKKDLASIDRTTKKTDDKIDTLYSERISDHYIKPNERIRKYIDAALKIAFGIFIAAFIYFLFPGLR